METLNVVIIGTILVCDRMTNALFDFYYTYSYVSGRFDSDFDILCDILDNPIRVSTLDDESIIVTRVYRVCLILFMGFQTWDYLVVLDMEDFDIILCVTWLYLHYVVINCNTKSVTLEILRREKLEWEGLYNLSKLKLYPLSGLVN